MTRDIIYQIFPDRFCDGNESNNPQNSKKWNSPVDRECFMGGDLEGIISKLDYIKALGATAIYLNPIFQSPSNHKYDTSDYFKIDDSFGTVKDFENLVTECHKKNIKIIIDGVFNHTSTEFFAFKDILINQEKSKYINWYHILNYPVVVTTPPPYKACGGASFLPKLNTKNLEVQNYIISIVKFWEGKGIDGIRFDVPFEIEPSLLKRIREETKLYLIGEIWGYGGDYVPRYFDGVTNYLLRDLIKKAVVNQCITSKMFVDEWNTIYSMYGDNINSMVNLAGSHDTERIYTLCENNINKEKIFYAFLFSLPGIPLIYYGDEIGLKGENDPYCRGCMDWDKYNWNKEIYNNIKELANINNTNEVFKDGKVKLTSLGERVLIITRYDNKKSISVIINFGFQSEIINGSVIEPMSFKFI